MSKVARSSAGANRLHRGSTHGALFSEFHSGFSVSSYWGVGVQATFVIFCVFTQLYLFPVVQSLLLLCVALIAEAAMLFLIVYMKTYLSVIQPRMSMKESTSGLSGTFLGAHPVADRSKSQVQPEGSTWLRRGLTTNNFLEASSSDVRRQPMLTKLGFCPICFHLVHGTLKKWIIQMRKKHRPYLAVLEEAHEVTHVLRTVAWCMQYIWATTLIVRDHPLDWWDLSHLPTAYFLGERIFLWLVNIDFCYGLVHSKNKWEYLFSLQSVLDFITMPPLMFAGHFFYQDERFTPSYYMVRFGWVRFLRLYRIMPVLEHFFHSVSRATLEIISIILALGSVVFAFAGVVYIQDSPCEEGAFESFFDYVYYAVITIKAAPPFQFERTGSFGVPWTRVFTVLAIVTAMTLIPMKIGHISRLLTQPMTQVGNVKTVVASPMGFILLAGSCTALQFEVWAEYYANFRDPGAPKALVYLHGGSEPVEAFVRVRWSLLHRCGIHLAVLQGDCAQDAEACLKRVHCSEAAAIVIFAELSTAEEVKADRLSVIRLLAVRKFKQMMDNVSTVFNQNSAKLLALDLGVHSVLVINELRMKLLAKSAVECPGLSTLVANLYHIVPGPAAEKMCESLRKNGFISLTGASSSSDSAAEEYVRGARYNAYQVRTPDSLVGMKFIDVVKTLQFRYDILLIGVRNRSQRLRLNPGPDYMIQPQDLLMCLLYSAKQLADLQQSEIKKVWNSLGKSNEQGEFTETQSEGTFLSFLPRRKRGSSSEPLEDSVPKPQMLPKSFADLLTKPNVASVAPERESDEDSGSSDDDASDDCDLRPQGKMKQAAKDLLERLACVSALHGFAADRRKTEKRSAEMPASSSSAIPQVPPRRSNRASTMGNPRSRPSREKQEPVPRRVNQSISMVVTSSFKYYEAKDQKVQVNDIDEARRLVWYGAPVKVSGDAGSGTDDRDLLLVCGWPRNLFGFLRTALRDSAGPRRCIILAPFVPSHTPLESLAEFAPSVLYVKGSALQRFDLVRAGVHDACSVVIFSEPHAVESLMKPQAAKYSPDVEAVLAVSKIRAMRDVPLVVELRDPMRNLCLLDGSTWTPSTEAFADLRYLDCPEYVGGSIWADEAVYSFASSELHPELLMENVVPASELAEHLVDGGIDRNTSDTDGSGTSATSLSSCMRMAPVPPSWHHKRYQALFNRLTKWGIVAVGLYREIETPAGTQHYVATSPLPDTLLSAGDRLYIIPPAVGGGRRRKAKDEGA